jgi:hypothetical protein
VILTDIGGGEHKINGYDEAIILILCKHINLSTNRNAVHENLDKQGGTIVVSQILTILLGR